MKLLVVLTQYKRNNLESQLIQIKNNLNFNICPKMKNNYVNYI